MKNLENEVECYFESKITLPPKSSRYRQTTEKKYTKPSDNHIYSSVDKRRKRPKKFAQKSVGLEAPIKLTTTSEVSKA